MTKNIGRINVFNTRSYESLIYVILWVIVLLYPLIAAVVISIREGTVILWNEVFIDWSGIAPFLLLFLLHRLPVHFLFKRHRIRLYVISALGLLCLFGLGSYFLDTRKPKLPDHRHEIIFYNKAHDIRPHPDCDKPGMGPKQITKTHPHLPFKYKGRGRPPFRPLLIDLVIATLMLGFDLAISIFFRYQEEVDKARRLETEHMRHQLEHLKAQVNPHFFMNMLNSIHGMVELKPAKAQTMIIELSQLMRYVLYEGAKLHTSLNKEINFIINYVELMRKRYSSRMVEIRLELPAENFEHTLIPPLLFINILENAFKHGISYQAHSFVDIRMSVESDSIHFECSNSIHRHLRIMKDVNTGGVGLANLRQRLQLLYNGNFTLETTEPDDKAYHVNMIIPYEYDTDKMHCR